jgi:dihydroorotate dehydrogenase electron transfer subunit
MNDDEIKFSNPHSATDKPFTTKITKIITNTQKVKTFFVDYAPNGYPVNILPGQFFMIWVPGVDEIPMSIAFIGKESEIGFTVHNVGEATNAIHKLKVGDYIGIRGPYGTPYTYKGGISIVIAGGTGIASLRELILGISRHNKDELYVIMGAKNKDELLFLDEFEKKLNSVQYSVCTDDGSYCNEGFPTDYFSNHIREIIEKSGKNKKITVYTCGPELMMKKAFEICEKYGIEMQASLERMMRCGFGLCGLCVLDPLGLKVCQDGPVFSSEVLRKVTDFGKNKRSVNGKKIKI